MLFGIAGALIGNTIVPGAGGLLGFQMGSSAGAGIGGAVGATQKKTIDVPAGASYAQGALPSYGGIAGGSPWMWEKAFEEYDKMKNSEQDNEQAVAFSQMLKGGYFQGQGERAWV